MASYYTDYLALVYRANPFSSKVTSAVAHTALPSVFMPTCIAPLVEPLSMLTPIRFLVATQNQILLMAVLQALSVREFTSVLVLPRPFEDAYHSCYTIWENDICLTLSPQSGESLERLQVNLHPMAGFRSPYLAHLLRRKDPLIRLFREPLLPFSSSTVALTALLHPWIFYQTFHLPSFHKVN